MSSIPKKTNLLILLLFFVVTVGPFALAWLNYSYGWFWTSAKDGKTNFVNPSFNIAYAFDEQESEEPKWKLLVSIPSSCNQDCAERLFYLRQIYLALGKNLFRVEQYAILDPAQSLDAVAEDILTENPYIQKLKNPKLYSQISTYKDQKLPVIFIVDPRGNMVLYYDSSHQPKEILKDLKKLMKYSRMG